MSRTLRSWGRSIEEGLRDWWELASGLVQVLAYDQGVEGTFYSAAVLRDPDGVEDVAVWVSPEWDATITGDPTDPDSVYLYAVDDVAAAGAIWRPDREPGYAADVGPITEVLTARLPVPAR